MTYSFDIFDTCLVRACGSPTAVFDILARRVLGDDAEIGMLMDFSAVRVAGEECARRINGKQEVTMADIYDQCDFSSFTDMPNQEISELEMAVERDMLVAVKGVRDYIDGLRDRGNTIIYISDMYLPSSWVKELLRDLALFKDGDRLYVSSEYNSTKASGDLFKLVAAENNIKFHRWIHHGDNPVSDCRIPRRMGIRARRIRHPYSYYERLLLRQSFFPGIAVNGILAGICRAVRLSGDKSGRRSFASDLIAPLYTVFVLGVLNDAFNRGIKRLFFLARDGHILYDIACCFKPLFPDIEVRYIYVSRASLYFPGLREISVESIKSLVKYDIKGGDIITTLAELMAPDIVKEISGIDPQLSGISDLDEGLSRILGNSRTRQVVENYHKTQRENIIGYFIQEGVAGGSRDVACVDIRGSRSCQIAMSDILEDYGFSRLRGYYLEVLDKRNRYGKNDPYYSIFYDGRYPGYDCGMEICGIGNILEEYYSASDDRRTLSYTKNRYGVAEPIFSEEEVPMEKKELYETNRDICRKFCKYIMMSGLYRCRQDMRHLSIITTADFLRSPRVDYLKPLYGIRQRGKRLINWLTPRNYMRRNYNWYDGSLVYTFRTPKILYLEKLIRKAVSRLR